MSGRDRRRVAGAGWWGATAALPSRHDRPRSRCPPRRRHGGAGPWRGSGDDLLRCCVGGGRRESGGGWRVGRGLCCGQRGSGAWRLGATISLVCPPTTTGTVAVTPAADAVVARGGRVETLAAPAGGCAAAVAASGAPAAAGSTAAAAVGLSGAGAAAVGGGELGDWRAAAGGDVTALTPPLRLFWLSPSPAATPRLATAEFFAAAVGGADGRLDACDPAAGG